MFEKNKPSHRDGLFYNISFLNSSGDFIDRYEGAISNTVFAPIIPSFFILYAARAHATNTDAVNSGFESSFKLYSIM